MRIELAHSTITNQVLFSIDREPTQKFHFSKSSFSQEANSSTHEPYRSHRLAIKIRASDGTSRIKEEGGRKAASLRN